MDPERRKIPKKVSERLKERGASFGSDLVRSSDVDQEFDAGFGRDQIRQKYSERYRAYQKLLAASSSEEDQVALQKLKVWIQALNNLDEYIRSHGTEGGVLRERQATVFEDIRDAFEQGLTKGYVKLPTGVGKTVLFSQVVDAMKLPTLILVPTKILVGQTGQKLDEFTDIDYGEYSSVRKNLTGNVDIMTYQSLVSRVASGSFDPKAYSLLILDEVHRALGTETRNVLEQFDAVTVGFTATPEFNKKSVGELLPTRFHELDIREAAETGLISRFRCIMVKTGIDLSAVPIVNGEYDQRLVERAVNQEARNKAAAELYAKSFHPRPAVAFCCGIEHAEKVAEEFSRQEISAEVVSGNMPDAERERALKDFREGRTQVLVNARVLIEGFDAPEATVAINLQPTLSRVVAEQRAGRVLRLNEGDREKWAYVIDFVDEDEKNPGISFAELVGQAEVQEMRFVPGSQGEGTVGGRRDLPDMSLEGMRVIYDTVEVMEVAFAAQEARAQSAVNERPSGWETPSELRSRLGLNPDKIRERAEIYRLERPDWFKVYSHWGKTTEHYDPALVALLVEKFPTAEAPPEGWRTSSSLMPELKTKNASIRKAADEYREEHPEWFVFFAKKGGKAEHYSPELVTLLKKRFEKMPAPEGWKTKGQLEPILKVKEKAILAVAAPYRIEHPEWFGVYVTKGNTVSEHFHPALITILSDHFAPEKVKAPPGWRTAATLSEELYGAAPVTITAKAEEYRVDHPEWFGRYRAGTMKAEYLHPELITLLKEHFATVKKEAPPGWRTANSLVLEFGNRHETIKKFAEQFRTEHPEWFEKFGTRTLFSEHYHPELVAKVMERFFSDRK